MPLLRRAVEEIKMHVAFRWFIGYLINEEIPHFATISYNFKHRYIEKIIEEIFYWILREIERSDYLIPEAIFVDGTHIKANAKADGRIAVLPYKRPMSKKDFFQLYQYVYDAYYNCVICPEN